ncbi:glycosyltransferase [Raphidocelis subcapitata]|uniref:Fucosyltransferase n=1 Tax=Raphidocelis subcapitata TaxID=307507 RepID=A0A2V0P8V1_9CHLO|nr:glycosyltransferase [Raphidocelis subcapitata]|eukprot:GBF95372.1 glycosyltransferase [Raphidocelis subcapitata]
MSNSAGPPGRTGLQAAGITALVCLALAGFLLQVRVVPNLLASPAHPVYLDPLFKPPSRTSSRLGGGGGGAASPAGPAAAGRAAPPPDADAVRRAADRPVVIGIVGGTGQGHLFGLLASGGVSPGKPWHEPGCSYQGVPINCTFAVGDEALRTADGLYFHVPRHPGRIMARKHEGQLRFAVSMESAHYYPWQDDPKYMCQYDVEATYRSCAQVPNNFHHERHLNLTTMESRLHEPEEPFESKLHAVAYINRNCNTRSVRSAVMAEWLRLHAEGKSKLAVHSYGCNANMKMPDHDDKYKVFRKYKYCITMENSISYDYVTEKLWDGLVAGCVPIYHGTHAWADIVPDPSAVVVYGAGGNASSVAELDALLDRVGSDKAAYERLLEWKRKPLEQLSPGYQAYRELVRQNNECRMCIHVIKHRMEPDPLKKRYTTCLWNETWLGRAGMPKTDLPPQC